MEAYRQDLRFFFAWTASVGLEVLAATRPHIELFPHHMEQRGLAAATIDRRLATVCGLYRFAHIDGRIGSNPAQYVRRPKVHPSQGHGMDRTELGRFLFTAEQLGHHRAALAVLLGLNGLRVSEACETDIGDLGFDRGYRTLRILGKRAGLGHVHPHRLRGAFIMAALDAGVPLRDVQLAERHADPRTSARDEEPAGEGA